VIRFVLFLLAGLFASAAPAAGAKRIAFSFDDVPRQAGAFMTPQERTERLIAALRRARVRQAAFFVNPQRLELPDGQGGEARIAAYVRAGHVIANHSFSHPSLTRVGPDAYIADIDRAAAWLHGRRGFRPWYRYPFLDEGARNIAWRDQVRAALAERGLRNGYITVDSYDWFLDDLANRARRAGITMDMNALRDLYVRIIVEAANFEEAIARATLGRSPVHVALMHETDLEAMFLADAVAALRADGWEIATIDEAYRDPIAAREPNAAYLGGGRVAALANEAGRAARELIPPMNQEATIQRLFNERVLHITVEE
jgi:peptidoglycan/xylan/chitin deacetylase (PgdA/CDA1 family)